jgi:hypothetical protein
MIMDAPLCPACGKLERLLRPAEVSELIGVPIRTLDGWRQGRHCNGPSFRLPYVQVGSRIRFKLTDVEAYIERNTVNPAR